MQALSQVPIRPRMNAYDQFQPQKQSLAPLKEVKVRFPAEKPALKAVPLAPVHEKSTVVSSLNAAVPDVDLGDAGNPLAVPVYVKEIYAYLRQREKKPEYRVPSDFLDLQPEIDSEMRAVVVDWMSEVHTKFKLANESIFLAVNILDRFLTRKQVAKDRLQLLGITSLLLASKFEESYTPSVRSFGRVAKDFSSRQILAMERMLLQVTEFNLSDPTSLTFLRRFAKVAELTNRDKYLAFYLAELANANAKMVNFLPSEIAAGALFLTQKIVRAPEVWTGTIEAYSKYSAEDLKDVTLFLKRCVYGAKQHQGIVGKYSVSRYYKVSTILNM
ncbi:Cyclin B [Carpediemonas membranifera]|uniref:Cyclin B n=1 Tax=Carpediemonas membranifera TaxID=201153 RepID=A0A8J6B8A0_9EUKA|nr:Cyclin B [Carpediemonas membranifera]|eukprot:KAG9395219.1 Cyclin B [Carpediemonas membranifera]